jgi:hypothetical protein
LLLSWYEFCQTGQNIFQTEENNLCLVVAGIGWRKFNKVIQQKFATG